MKDLHKFLNESLLDDFDNISDKIDDNPFSPIFNAKDEKVFLKAIDNLLALCDKVNISSIDQKTYKNSFFLSDVCYMSGKPLGLVIDKMLKKTSKSILIRSVYEFSTGDDNTEFIYYPREKMDINFNDRYDIHDEWSGNFDTYLLYNLYIMPKHIEKCYLDFIKELKPKHGIFSSKWGGEIISGERLVKKIS